MLKRKKNTGNLHRNGNNKWFVLFVRNICLSTSLFKLKGQVCRAVCAAFLRL
jgi:hypothetical protein